MKRSGWRDGRVRVACSARPCNGLILGKGLGFRV